MKTKTKSKFVVQGDGKLEIGKKYTCIHTRKGTFDIRITHLSDEWATGVVVNGTAKAMMSYNVKEAGDEVVVRDSLAYFIPLD